MNLNVSRITVIFFVRKTNSNCCNYKLRNKIVTRTRCVEDLGILLDCKLYFHSRVDCIFFFTRLKMLGPICFITSPVSSIDSLNDSVWPCPV
jgi:hypothetical protein